MPINQGRFTAAYSFSGNCPTKEPYDEDTARAGQQTPALLSQQSSMICQSSLDNFGEALANNLRALKATPPYSETSTTIYANDMEQPSFALPSTTVQPTQTAHGRQEDTSDDESVRPTRVLASPSHSRPFFNPPTLESTPCSSTTTQNTAWMQPAWTRDLPTMNPTQYILTETAHRQLIHNTAPVARCKVTCVGADTIEDGTILTMPNIHDLIRTLATVNHPNAIMVLVAILEMPSPYTCTLFDLPRAAREHYNYNPITVILPDHWKDKIRDHLGLPSVAEEAEPPRATLRRHGENELKIPWSNNDDPNYNATDCNLYNTYAKLGYLTDKWAWVQGVGPAVDPKTGLRIHHATHKHQFHPPLVRGRGHQPKYRERLCEHFTSAGHCRNGLACADSHTELMLARYRCKNFLRGQTCDHVGRRSGRSKTCDHAHGLDFLDPTGTETSQRNVHHDTLPEALTSTPFPPPITDHMKKTMTNPMWIPIPSPALEADNTFQWDDAAYGLPPKIPGQYVPPEVPEEIHALQTAIEFIIGITTSNNNMPLEAAEVMLEEAIPRFLWYLEKPRTTNQHSPMLKTYNPSLEELQHGHPAIRPSANDLTTTYNSIAKVCRNRIQRARETLAERRLTDPARQPTNQPTPTPAWPSLESTIVAPPFRPDDYTTVQQIHAQEQESDAWAVDRQWRSEASPTRKNQPQQFANTTVANV